jgi:hypothetical protein
MFKNIVSLPVRMLSSVRGRVAAASAFIAAAIVVAAPAAALATESATEEKLKTVTTQVSSEGVDIVLAILAGLVALIAAIIIIPKGISMIKRFI